MQQTATVQVISTASSPVADCFPYWADVVTQAFVPLECDTPVRQDFFGSIRYRRVGRIGIADVYGSPQRVRRTRAKIVQSPRDDLIAVVHVAGRCNVGQQSRTALLSVGEGAVVSTRETYFFEFPDAFRQLVLKVPPSLLPVASGRGIRLAAGPCNLLRHLALGILEAPDEVGEEIAVERAMLELMRSAATPMSADGMRAGTADTRYAQACGYILRNLSDPALSPAVVAAHIGLSSRSLARLFAMNGQTIERSIWSRRLAAARDALADPRLHDRSITDIAFSCGFNDAAHFSRSFLNAYGMTPRQFRARRLTG
jgi:AraC-like DNA-binding protein